MAIRLCTWTTRQRRRNPDVSSKASTAFTKLIAPTFKGAFMCTIACPFGNIVYDAIAAAPLKCDTCGGDPSCARYCPTQALEWVDDNISTRDRKKNYAAKFKIAFGEGGL